MNADRRLIVSVPRASGKFNLTLRLMIDHGGIAWLVRPGGLFLLATTPNPFYPIPKKMVERYAPR